MLWRAWKRQNILPLLTRPKNHFKSNEMFQFECFYRRRSPTNLALKHEFVLRDLLPVIIYIHKFSPVLDEKSSLLVISWWISINSVSLPKATRRFSCLNKTLNFECQKIVFEYIRHDAIRTFDEPESKNSSKFCS